MNNPKYGLKWAAENDTRPTMRRECEAVVGEACNRLWVQSHEHKEALEAQRQEWRVRGPGREGPRGPWHSRQEIDEFFEQLWSVSQKITARRLALNTTTEQKARRELDEARSTLVRYGRPRDANHLAGLIKQAEKCDVAEEEANKGRQELREFRSQMQRNLKKEKRVAEKVAQQRTLDTPKGGLQAAMAQKPIDPKALERAIEACMQSIASPDDLATPQEVVAAKETLKKAKGIICRSAADQIGKGILLEVVMDAMRTEAAASLAQRRQAWLAAEGAAAAIAADAAKAFAAASAATLAQRQLEGSAAEVAAAAIAANAFAAAISASARCAIDSEAT